ncbi:hypothetical protein LV164_008177 [Aspergillus fumigatus]|nr:hypothetical protein KXW25_005902 [Aspergillus fumigatus]KAH3004265.1 hypothetical protein KXW60_005795 [Aspergillus fumigatus]KAH3205071.1 hypothetical protein KXW62_005456 [Aspergillus fumigatus]KAH3266462.1 hypothetical protein KXW55_006076 [Aspergillus fumigatus]KAH3539811.1 hypothetical protein KXV64_006718 [Aspergillus fumigatus]
MKMLGILLVLLSWTGYVTANNMEKLAAALPSCALQCMVSTIPHSPCTLTNQTCMCTDPVFTGTLEICVQAKCTIRESLATKNVTSSACEMPVRDRTRVVSIAGVAGGALALFAFVFRMIARLPCCGGQFGMDDLAMIVTMSLVIPLSALSAVLANLGLGKDIWTVSPDNITHILYSPKIYFYDELLYLSIIPLTKISICLFYLRVFPARPFRMMTYIVIGLNTGFLIAFVLISVFQCRPIKGAWLHWDGEGHYSCNNINAQGWSAAAINMVLDLIVMALPLRELYRLNLSLRKKLFVMSMFSLGIFVTLVSIVRLNSLIHFAATNNLTWDYVEIGYWSTIEVHVGIICACLPAIRALLRRLCPTLFGDTTGAASKPSGTRSGRAASRGEGNILNRPSLSAWPEGKFVPLVDLEHPPRDAGRPA